MIGLLTAFLIPKTLDHGAKRSKSMVHKVFVYGTLKRNEPNHHWLTNPENGTSKFEANGTTLTRYPLIIATRYNIPFLLKAPGTGWFVKGEVYEVDDYMLGQLDILEDHPNYYVRELDQILVKDEKTNEEYKVECWIYSLPKFRPELLTLPMEEDYRSEGPHGRPYLERDNESTPEDVDEECDEIAKKYSN